MSEDRAEAVAWASVNKESGGGNLSGSGRGVPDTQVAAQSGGAAAAVRPAAKKSVAARRGPAIHRKSEKTT